MSEDINNQANETEEAETLEADNAGDNTPSALRGALAIPEPDEENELLVKRESFAVTDFKSAAWVVGRIKACRDYVDDVKTWAQAEEKKAREAEEFYLRNYGEQLKELAQNTLQDVGRKYLDLPGARVQLRKQPIKLVIEDEEAVFEWAQDNCPAAVKCIATIDLTALPEEQMSNFIAMLTCEPFNQAAKTETTVSKSELNNHFKSTGEVPLGCTVEGGSDEVYVQ